MKKLIWMMAMVLPMVVFMGCSSDETTELPHYPDLIKGGWSIYEIDGKSVEGQGVVLVFQDNYAISKNYPYEGETHYHMKHEPITAFKLTISGSTDVFYMDVYGTSEKKGIFDFFYEHGKDGKEPEYICRMKGRKMDITEETE